MRVRTYNLICNTLFWIKTFIALLCATAGLGYLSYRVYDLRIKAEGSPFIDTSASFTSSSFALVPQNPYVYLGFSINWFETEPSKVSLNGKRPLLYDYSPEFSLSNPNFYDSAMLKAYARKVKKVGGILQLTIVPDSQEQFVALNTMPDRAFSMLATDCEDINNMGVPVFLNFAPDMNANFHKYKLNPAAYKEGFQRMTNEIRAKKLFNTGKKSCPKLSVMVWTPSAGYDYPNIGEPLPAGNFPLTLLDTSLDGKLGPEDDPYLPYYPGDDFVDWVGLSNNWVSNVLNAPNVRNGPPPAGFYEGLLNGNQNFLTTINSAGTTANLNFYERFARTKPMILSQIGVSIQRNGPDSNDEAIIAYKSTIWEQILNGNFLSQFPNLKGVVINEAERLYKNDNSIVLDFRVLNPPTYSLFITRISSDDVRMLLPYVGILKADRNGKIFVTNSIP